LEHKPIGLEGFDHMLVDFMRRKGLALRDLSRLPAGVSFLLVEVGAWSEQEVRERSEHLARACQSWPVPPIARICTPQEAESIWHVRDSALGAVVFVPGEPNRYEGWEDAAVPPEQLGNYLRQITTLMDEYGYKSPLYGHYGQGCVHTRINFDFHSQEGLRKFREFISRAADVVLSFGGSLSGEHGDGQSRAALLPKMFGPELMQAFREFKVLFDPDNRMNPGKLMDAVRVYDPVENLRHEPPELAIENAALKNLETHFAFSADNGSFALATERCVGVGACRNTTGGVMCPSYRATGEERHSTRGRARLLWELLTGALRTEGFESESVHEALDLCLSCKACKSECPVQVDIAAWKSEFLAQHYKGRLHPVQHYIFGFANRLARWGSLTPALTNALLTGPMTSPMIKHIARVAQERQLPRLAEKSFQKSRTADSEASNVPREAAQKPAKPLVVLWPDTWNNYYHPQTLAAAEKVLIEAGFRVQVPKGHICCGRPLYDFGLLRAARSYLADILEQMAPQIDAGLPFIFLEPSCASVFKDEMLELFPSDARAKRLSRQVWLLADWLAANTEEQEWLAGRLAGASVLVHGHCHHKAVFGGSQTEVALLQRAGATVAPIQAGCCGMAGPFGFEADKFEISKAIAQDGLLPAVEAASPVTLIVADGFSCREQIAQLSDREAMHFAEVLAHNRGCGPS
jgi:Fe-S oxidoreductase